MCRRCHSPTFLSVLCVDVVTVLLSSVNHQHWRSKKVSSINLLDHETSRVPRGGVSSPQLACVLQLVCVRVSESKIVIFMSGRCVFARASVSVYCVCEWKRKWVVYAQCVCVCEWRINFGAYVCVYILTHHHRTLIFSHTIIRGSILVYAGCHSHKACTQVHLLEESCACTHTHEHTHLQIGDNKVVNKTSDKK